MALKRDKTFCDWFRFSRSALQISIITANRLAVCPRLWIHIRYYSSEALLSLSVGFLSVRVYSPSSVSTLGFSLDSTTLSPPSVVFLPLCWACPSSNCSIPLPPALIPTDSDNSLLRYLSDDKILVIEEEPEGPGRESRRDSTRRSRRKSRNPSSPSFPISPSMLSSTLRLDQPPDALPVCTQSLKLGF